MEVYIRVRGYIGVRGLIWQVRGGYGCKGVVNKGSGVYIGNEGLYMGMRGWIWEKLRGEARVKINKMLCF